MKLYDFSNSEQNDNISQAWTNVIADESHEMMCNDLDTTKVMIIDVSNPMLKFAVIELEREYTDAAAVEVALVAIWDARATYSYEVYPVAVAKLYE